MELTSNQTMAVCALRWLLSEVPGNRREGRTTAIAVALILKAIDSPGTPIPYWDHFDTQRGNDLTRGEIDSILNRGRGGEAIPGVICPIHHAEAFFSRFKLGPREFVFKRERQFPAAYRSRMEGF